MVENSVDIALISGFDNHKPIVMKAHRVLRRKLVSEGFPVRQFDPNWEEEDYQDWHDEISETVTSGLAEGRKQLLLGISGGGTFAAEVRNGFVGEDVGLITVCSRFDFRSEPRTPNPTADTNFEREGRTPNESEIRAQSPMLHTSISRLLEPGRDFKVTDHNTLYMTAGNEDERVPKSSTIRQPGSIHEVSGVRGHRAAIGEVIYNQSDIIVNFVKQFANSETA